MHANVHVQTNYLPRSSSPRCDNRVPCSNYAAMPNICLIMHELFGDRFAALHPLDKFGGPA